MAGDVSVYKRKVDLHELASLDGNDFLRWSGTVTYTFDRKKSDSPIPAPQEEINVIVKSESGEERNYYSNS